MTNGRFPRAGRPAFPADDGLRPVDRFGGGETACDHRHWHALGRPTEMIEFNRLQVALPAGLSLPEDAAARLAGSAAGAGLAAAERRLCALGGAADDETMERFVAAEDDGEYRRAVDFSERILARGADGMPRAEAAAALCRVVREAYLDGFRRALAAAPSGHPGP